MKITTVFILLTLLSVMYSCSDEQVIFQEPEQPEQPEQPVESVPEPESSLPMLTVVGRYLKNETGETVNLHGYAQTFSPWFNEQGKYWTNYDVEGCLYYNKQKIDQILSAGWRMDFVRMHMDPYWSNTPGISVEGENDIQAFSFERFKRYLDEVFVPMALYAVEKGLYVVMRPPGVCPKEIAVGDAYHQYLLKVWKQVAAHTKLKNNTRIMFELANEPIHILGSDGQYGSGQQDHFNKMKEFFQAIVDEMRAEGCNNILWIPGLGYQSQYSGFASNPVTGNNIGYAVHAYPGWYGSDCEVPSAELGGVDGGGYEGFQRGWNAQVAPVAAIAPVMVTEMDWAPEKYNASWGKSITGMAGDRGFGANFKYIADLTGNVSWLLFTSPEYLAQFRNVPGTEGTYTFLTDPEACPWPVYHWYQEYAGEAAAEGELTGIELSGVESELQIHMGDSRYIVVKAHYADGSSRMVTATTRFSTDKSGVVEIRQDGRLSALQEGETTLIVEYTSRQDVSRQKALKIRVVSPFLLTAAMFNPSIWENGTFDETTRTLVTGQYGFGGWQYADGLDLSAYKTLTVELGNDNESNVSFRLFDKNSYWTKPATYDFGSSRKVVVNLNQMIDENGAKIDSSHLYFVGFWSMGGKPIVISNVSLAN